MRPTHSPKICFLAFERTGDRKYFDLGKRYLLDKGFFDPLAEGRNVLTGLHAYSHVNALSSGMQGYLKLGDTKYFKAVKNAVDMILKDQSYATGGWGPNEALCSRVKANWERACAPLTGTSNPAAALTRISK